MIVAGIFEQAQAAPKRTALDYNDERWSYAAFADAIARARGFLHRRGIEGDGVAVVAVSHLRDSWVAILALRSLGLTTCPVQSSQAIVDLRLRSVRCVVSSTTESWGALSATCNQLGLEHVRVSFLDEQSLGLDATSYRQGGHILLTSGTTGDYKKIYMDPAFEDGYLRRRGAVTGVGRDTVINVFDFAPWTGAGYTNPATVWPRGGTVVFSQWRPYHLSLRRPGLTYSSVLPQMLTEILAQPEDSFPRSESMTLGVGGGAITQAQIDEAKRRISPHLVNGLIATESYRIAMTPLNTPDDHRWHILEPTTVVELVDEFDQPVPIGQIGRLRVGTDGGPTSYLDDEEATKTFFKDGFFYPGDLAVMREDGRIALHGRVTDVINIQGHKIAPAPIEDRMREALGVAGVCLVSMQDASGEETMHVAIEAGSPVESAVLSPVLQQELSGVTVVHVHYVAALPRNVAGKLLRRELTTQLAARS